MHFKSIVAKTTSTTLSSFFFTLEDNLNSKHPLYILANRVDWQQFETVFSPLFYLDNGHLAKAIRLMVGSLLVLKHIRNFSDESIVEHQFVQAL